MTEREKIIQQQKQL
ncbi:hypothetical protein BVZ80_00778A, partial [Haemophilus influenzae]